MHPLFTKYGQYALFPVISGSAHGTFVGGYTVSLFEAAINNYTHLLSGVAPGLFATEGEAREAALVAAREAADGLNPA
jgi:hypothetical protein